MPTTTTTTTTTLTVTTRNHVPQALANHAAPQEIVTMAHIAAPKLSRIEDRKKPLKLCVALDVSGSMSGKKLELAIRSLEFIVDELRDGDDFSVVIFNENARTIVNTTCTRGSKDRIKTAIKTSCRASGNTNLSAGLFQALSLVLPAFVPTYAMPYPMPYPSVYPMPHPMPYPMPHPMAYPMPHPMANTMPYPMAYPSVAGPRMPASMPPSVVSVAAAPTAVSAPTTPPKAPRLFFVTIKGQHALVPRNGAKLHAYWIQLVTTPANALASATIHANGSTAKSGADIALDPQEAPVVAMAVDMIVKGGAAVKVLHILADPLADETAAVYKVEDGVAVAHTGPVPDLEPLPDAAPAPVLPTQPLPTTTTTTTTTTLTTTFNDSHCRSIMVLTDGEANRGITDARTITSQMMSRIKASGADASVFTFGFGSEPKVDLLRSIATATQGMYYFVPDVASMAKTFADCVGGLVSTVAQAVRVTITPAPGVGIVKVLTYYPVTVNSDGSVTVTMKDLFSEELRDLPVRVGLAPGFVEAADVPILDWKVEYQSCLTAEPEMVKSTSCVTFKTERYCGEPDTVVDEQLNRFVVAEALEEAKAAAAASNFPAARMRLEKAKATVMSSASAAKPFCANLAAEMEDFDDCLDERVWGVRGEQMVANAQMQHAQQRCASSSVGGAYANAYKDDMKARVKFA